MFVEYITSKSCKDLTWQLRVRCFSFCNSKWKFPENKSVSPFKSNKASQSALILNENDNSKAKHAIIDLKAA